MASRPTVGPVILPVAALLADHRFIVGPRRRNEEGAIEWFPP